MDKLDLISDFETAHIEIIKAKSILKIGKEKALIIETDATFNKLQKRMWKFLLNIDIVDVKE